MRALTKANKLITAQEFACVFKIWRVTDETHHFFLLFDIFRYYTLNFESFSSLSIQPVWWGALGTWHLHTILIVVFSLFFVGILNLLFVEWSFYLFWLVFKILWNLRAEGLVFLRLTELGECRASKRNTWADCGCNSIIFGVILFLNLLFVVGVVVFIFLVIVDVVLILVVIVELFHILKFLIIIFNISYNSVFQYVITVLLTFILVKRNYIHWITSCCRPVSKYDCSIVFKLIVVEFVY